MQCFAAYASGIITSRTLCLWPFSFDLLPLVEYCIITPDFSDQFPFPLKVRAKNLDPTVPSSLAGLKYSYVIIRNTS